MICSVPFSVTVVKDFHIRLLWGKYVINYIHFLLAKVLQENSLGTTVDLTDKSLEGYLGEGRGGEGREIWSQRVFKSQLTDLG